MKDDVPTLRWKAFERQRTGWYATGTRMAANQFVAEKKEVVGTVRAGADPAKVIKAQRKAWGIMYLKLYLGIGADFAPRAIGELKSASPDVVKAADDVWMRIVSDYVRRYSGSKIRGIEDATLGLVRQALADGVEAGEGTDQLARRVAGTYDAFAGYRAERVARTEVVSASNLGSRAGALSTGLDLTHSWLATRDDRTRDIHASVDGQTQAMNDPYTVEGEELMFPGDTSKGASAGNVVNCRCTETFQAR